MALTLNAEQQMLRDNARDWVRDAAPVGHLRRLRNVKEPNGFSPELWIEMAKFGWPGIVFPEAYGGMGLGFVELGVVIEELGRTLTPTPMMSSVLLAGSLLLDGASDSQKSKLLPGVCEGTRVLALAFEESPRFRPHQVRCRAERRGDHFELSGEKRFVLDGHVAETLIVSARTSGDPSDRAGISLFLVDANAKGVRIERTRMIDDRNAARVSLEAVSLPLTAAIGTLDRGADLLDPVLDRATACLAAELLGIIAQAYDTTLEYLKTRVQFDVLIGSFQALQHRAVDMFCEIELCKSLVMDALSAIDDKRDDASAMASAAKARVSEASRWITREAIQLHGGIGMTDEHDIGFYLKRAAVAESTLGDAIYHRDRFAKLRGF
ncbi:MAG TPA: acyl-CoA dehydrogenase family protein [Polyangiales bacterium]|jgi:acyl-CoA dehydrogenase